MFWLPFFRWLGTWWTPRWSVPTQGRQPSFRIRRGCWLEKLARRSSHETIKTSVWVSRCPRRPRRAPILTRNAPLLLMSPSEGAFCLVWGPDEEAEDHCHPKTTATAWERTSASRNTSGTWPCTCPPALGIQIANTVIVGESRPLRKTALQLCSKSWRLLATRSNSRSSETRHLSTPSKKIKLFSKKKKKEALVGI